jgi:hypothetical protein
MKVLSQVGIHAEHRERQVAGCLLQGLDHQQLVAHRHGDALCPAAGDVGQHQAVHVVAIGLRAAAVLDHVDLEEARRRVAPVGEGAHRNAAPDGRAHTAAPLAPAIDVPARFAQRPVDRRRADLQDLLPDQGIELQMAVTLHGLYKDRDQHLEPLAADPVAGFPQHDERLANSLVVDTVALGSRLLALGPPGQKPDDVLAVVAGQGYYLVEDAALLTSRCLPVSLPDCLDQLPARCHADSPLHVVLPSDHPTGSKLREQLS